MVPLELHPHGIAPIGGNIFSSPCRGPYPYGVLTLLGSPNLFLTYPTLKKHHKNVLNLVGAIPRGCNSTANLENTY